MKKWLILIVNIVAFILSVCISVDSIDTTVNRNGAYTYQLNHRNEAAIVHCEMNEKQKSIEVPDTIDGYPVKTIKSNAFDCTKIENIILSDNIETVEKNAFVNCDNVIFLSLGSQINSEAGFQNLNHLKTLQITYGIGGFMNDYVNAEKRCYNSSAAEIETLIINNGVRYLSDYAFCNLSSLNEVILPESIESVGEYCFNNTPLPDLSFTSNLNSLARYALNNDDSNNKPTILLPDSITYMGQNCLNPNASYICYQNSKAQQYLHSAKLKYQSIDLSFTQSQQTVQLGESVQLQLNDASLVSTEITYTSSDQSICVVDHQGVVKAYGTGKAIITARSKSGSSMTAINVEYPASNNNKTYYKLIGVGKQFTIDGKSLFEQNNRKITYRSLDETIANVDDSGLVTGAEIGETMIEITCGSNVIYYAVEVNRLISRLSVEEDTIELSKGESAQMNVYIFPDHVSNDYLTYTSSDNTVALVNEYGTITALKNGTCMITAQANDGSLCSTEMKVNVSTSLIDIQHVSRIQVPGKYYTIYASSNDGASLLYDSSNPDVADVDENGVIHAKMEGTCSINVHTANNSAFTSFDIRVCDGVAFGIDISQWNGRYNTLDTFKAVKEDGVDFVYIRFAYSDGDDRVYERNYNYAKEAGLDVGAYHYIIATTVDEAIVEAQYMLTLLKGKTFDYPIAIDIEDEEQKALDNETFNAILRVYSTILRDAGYCTIVYSSASILNKTDQSLEYWMAHWGPLYPNYYKGRYTIWQYSSNGKIKGFSSAVDLDISFFDYPSYIKRNHLNGY